MEWLQDLAAVIRIDQVAFAGIITLTIVMILRGQLVPKSVLDDRTVDRDKWQAAYLESEKARSVLMNQNGELLEVAKTANHILRSLPGGDSNAGQTTSPPHGETIR